MAKSLSSFKKTIQVNTRLNVTNYGKGQDYVGTVYSVNKTYFTVAREVSKKFYDKWSSILKDGSFEVIDDKRLVSSPKYFALSHIYWQPARHSQVVSDEVIEFLSYPNKLSSGRVAPAPFENVPVGQTWLSITKLSSVGYPRYW